MKLDGITLLDPSSVEPHPTLVSRPWLKSLVIRDLKETTPGLLVKFLSLFQHIEELRFEGYSGLNCCFTQLQHLRIDSALLPILPPPQHRDEDDVKVAVGCALKTIATNLGLHDVYAQKPKYECEKLKSIEANLVYLPAQIIDINDDDDWVDECGEESGEEIKQARLFSAIKEDWKIQGIFNAYSSLRIKLGIPKRDDGVADMLRQRFCDFCDEESEDRWQTGLEIESSSNAPSLLCISC